MSSKQVEIYHLLIILLILFILAIGVYWISSINTFTETFIPAVIILISNVFSREPGSHRYEQVTALFGWAAGIFIWVWLILSVTNYFLVIFHLTCQLLINIQKISFQIFTLNIVAALSRDYEKMLKPKANSFEEKLLSFYNLVIKIFKR